MFLTYEVSNGHAGTLPEVDENLVDHFNKKFSYCDDHMHEFTFWCLRSQGFSAFGLLEREAVKSERHVMAHARPTETIKQHDLET